MMGNERRLLLLLSLAVMAFEASRVALAAASQNQPGAAQDAGRSVILRAEESLRHGDAAGAARMLSEWLTEHPHDVAARTVLGAAYRSSGDDERAERAFQSVLEDDPRSVEALTALGSLYAQQGRLEEAETLLARAAKLQPDSPEIRRGWASVLARLHRYPQAAAALEGLPVPGPPGERIAYERLKASIDLGRGDRKAAARDMERALKLAPGDLNLQLATGIAESEAAAWTEAIAHLAPVFAATRSPVAGFALLQAELAAHADHRQTLKELGSLDLPLSERLPLEVRLGEVLSSAGLHADAVQAFEKAILDAPERSDLYFDLALAQFRAGRLDEALGSAKRSKSLSDSADLESLIGDIQEARGDSLDAVHSYQAAVSLAPDQEQYRLALGLELLRHGTFEPAKVVFEQAAKAFPQSSRVRVAEGLTAYFLEQYPEAIKTLLEALEMDPKSDLAIGYLGEIQLQQPVSPDPEAIDRVCRYADSHPGNGEALGDCGALRLRLEHDRGDAAPSAGTLERLRRAARLVPGSATAHCGLGQALEWTRQWQEAEGQIEACIRLRPESVEAHYRAANIARHLGETERAQQELKLHDTAQQRLVEANALRDRVIQKFLYTITEPGSHDRPQP